MPTVLTPLLARRRSQFPQHQGVHALHAVPSLFEVLPSHSGHEASFEPLGGLPVADTLQKTAQLLPQSVVEGKQIVLIRATEVQRVEVEELL